MLPRDGRRSIFAVGGTFAPCVSDDFALPDAEWLDPEAEADETGNATSQREPDATLDVVATVVFALTRP